MKRKTILSALLVALAAFVLGGVGFIHWQYPAHILMKPGEYYKVWQVLTGQMLLLSEFQPQPALRVSHKLVEKAKFPVIDFHFHLGSLQGESVTLGELVAAMDACGVRAIVNLDSEPRMIEKYRQEIDSRYPDRFIQFHMVRFGAMRRDREFITDLVAQLEAAVRSGARGVKVWKNFGLTTVDMDGRLVPVDDERLDLLWRKAAQLEVPVLIHTADPTPFFSPADRHNERYEELRQYPEWSLADPRFPRKAELLAQRENLLKKHPDTVFVGAHLGDNGEDLQYIGHLLDTYPNYYVDISSRLSELGRQPYAAREFFMRYQDRILFGTDGGYGLGLKGWSIERFYRTYFCFLETASEYFDYPLWGVSNQGRWKIYGLYLPDEVLQKVYYRNAAKLLKLEK